MIKRVILGALCLSVVFAFMGCKEDSNASSKASSLSEAESVISSDSGKEDTKSKAEESNAESVSSDSFVDVGGTSLYVPDGFEEELAYGYYIWSKTYGDDTVYFAFYNNEWYNLDTDTDSYDLDDVPEIQSDSIPDYVYEVIPHLESKFKMSVDSNEKIEVNGLPILNHKGIMHTEDAEPSTRDLKYTAYYTLYDNDYYTKIPTFILLFSDCKDAETEKELDRLAEEITEKTVWSVKY